MVNPQVHGVKRGVLLLNNRVVVPDSFPGVSRVDQVVVTPVLRSVSWEGDYWRYAGVLQVKVTYGAVKTQTNLAGIKAWDPDRSLSLYAEKNFYDDGFSDHDEFAEEEFILLEEGPAPELLGFAPEVHSLEQAVEFAGLSPAVGAGLPEADCLIPRVIDVELKVRDERILDMSAVLVLEEEDSQMRRVPGGNALEFRHPLSISSWPPGMAEVLEWQVGFKEGESVFRDNEVLVSGELVIQVIGVEKEGGEREFSNVTTDSPVFWEIPIPPATDRSLVNGVKVAISRVQEDSAGLAVFGALYLDIAEESMPADRSEEILIPFDQPEETLVPPEEVESLPMPGGQPEEIMTPAETEQPGEVMPESEGPEDTLMPPEEPARPVFTGIGIQDYGLGWLKDWADGQGTVPGDRNELPKEDYNLPVDVTEGEQCIQPEGLCSEDIDPDAEELLRSLDIALEEIPTLEEVMAEFTDRSYTNVDDEFAVDRRIAGASSDLAYGLRSKVQENHVPGRKSLTQLKFISREALQERDDLPKNEKRARYGEPAPEKLPQAAKGRLSSQKLPNRTGSSQVRRIVEKNSGSKSIGTWTLYLVKPGDSLGEICRRYGIDSETVKERNQLSGNSLEPGSTIWIPK